MTDEELNRLFLSKMTERMVRMNMLDIPRRRRAIRDCCVSCAPLNRNWRP
jgi:hypothetical protein